MTSKQRKAYKHMEKALKLFGYGDVSLSNFEIKSEKVRTSNTMLFHSLHLNFNTKLENKSEKGND